MDQDQSSRSEEQEGTFRCGPIDFTDPMGRHLLKGISLTLKPPELCVLAGPSGSGKTSLLRAISGLNKAEVAERRLGNRSFSDRKLPQWRSRVTLLLQDAPCIHGTIRKNLEFPFSFKNCPHKEFSKQGAKRLLKEVGLYRFGLEHPVEGLSGGERHRLALVRGLLWAPPVLLCDEPLSGLEPGLAQRCFELLKEYSRNPARIVICVLHQERFAQQADTVFRLNDGTLHRA